MMQINHLNNYSESLQNKQMAAIYGKSITSEPTKPEGGFL